MAKVKGKKPENENRIFLNIKYLINTAAILAAFLLFVNSAFSNFGGYGKINLSYDDNPFLDTNFVPGGIFTPAFGFGYFPDSIPIGISINASYTHYTAFPLRDNVNLAFMLSYNLKLSETADLSLKTSISDRNNGIETEYYDYLQVILNAKYEINNKSNTFGISYLPRYKQYSNFKELSFLENRFIPEYYFQISKLSALYLESEIALKHFTDRYQETIPETPINTSGNGRKRRIKAENVFEPGIVNTENDSYLANIYASYILNLSENSGLALNLYYNFPLNKNNASLLTGTIDLNSDPELFDDEYSYFDFSPSLSYNIIIKDYFLSLNFNYSDKSFLYSIDDVVDNQDFNKRSDQRIVGSVNVTRQFTINNKLLELSFDYTHLQNKSNLNNFNFINNLLSISTRFTF